MKRAPRTGRIRAGREAAATSPPATRTAVASVLEAVAGLGAEELAALRAALGVPAK